MENQEIQEFGLAIELGVPREKVEASVKELRRYMRSGLMEDIRNLQLTGRDCYVDLNLITLTAISHAKLRVQELGKFSAQRVITEIKEAIDEESKYLEDAISETKEDNTLEPTLNIQLNLNKLAGELYAEAGVTRKTMDIFELQLYDNNFLIGEVRAPHSNSAEMELSLRNSSAFSENSVNTLRIKYMGTRTTEIYYFKGGSEPEAKVLIFDMIDNLHCEKDLMGTKYENLINTLSEVY